MGSNAQITTIILVEDVEQKEDNKKYTAICIKQIILFAEKFAQQSCQPILVSVSNTLLRYTNF